MSTSEGFRHELRRIFEGDPLSEFYNLDGLRDVVLTCDVDWAPDFAIDLVFEAVRRHGFSLTAFSTHESPLLRDPPSHVEIGLHPNFTRPDGADSFARRLDALRSTFPDATGLRSHRNLFGQNIVDLAVARGLEYDASTVLWNEPFCQSHRGFRGLRRYSYTWEGGLHLDLHPELDWDGITLETPGLKILNVHPALIYLNSATEQHRRAVTSRYDDLTRATREEIDPLVNPDRGIRDLWVELLDVLADRGVRTHTLGDLTRTAASREESSSRASS